MLSKCPGKRDIFEELRVRFAMFPKISISGLFFVSNNFVSEGIWDSWIHLSMGVLEFPRPETLGLAPKVLQNLWGPPEPFFSKTSAMHKVPQNPAAEPQIGNGRNTVLRVLFRKRELSDSVLRQTR